MSVQLLIESMEKLLSLHQQLHTTALEKTEAIKINEIKNLDKLLRDEQKLVTSIQIEENKRQQATAILTNDDKTTTISQIIQQLDGTNREILSELHVKLTAVISELQETNVLNQQLLQYSLQYINLNLDLLSPEPELPNYTKSQGEASGNANTGRSVFDSKA
ncbi:flagellar protein FlgN [Bacillus sp. FJAT-49732]|uniref:Flagellar protein FlgN n=1 Tax=Lederbergia citrisecunda TaxID=2833583 RepID=A0A942TN68_9BACI|nr:flagellar protein FlgN [Lederbergia citrisecunda]MBS4200398.1 flagellar protein FlgN [Lederbergia citrisecunda]